MSQSSSNLVEINLDKPRQFRLRPIEASNACNALSIMPGKGYVDTQRLLTMLGGLDWDAWAVVLSEGLKHEDPAMRRDRAMRLLMEALEGDPDLMEQLSNSVIKAGQITGVFRRTEATKEDARGKDSRGLSHSET